MTKIKQMLCALLTVCLLLIGSTNAMAAQPDTPSISVSANASIEVAPDTAVISFDVNGKGRTAAEATSASAAKMDSVKRNLLGCNILGNDITTTSYTLYPDTDIKGKITGYTASNSVRIKLKDISKLSPVIDKSVLPALIQSIIFPSASAAESFTATNCWLRLLKTHASRLPWLPMPADACSASC